ncbi:uncharacterized protein LOC125499949 isoform X3 [Athalia rosae]|uniref:uncharacterized protein LOC125499949 isoform X3 n=1 Tax=Athalia rosae TaxID=37344 RepID=UPI0020335B70|nr:uncharacterized protein LOC125499949 isoform X3 [Athalia rosae]
MSTEFGMIFLRVYDRWIHILRLALQNCDWMSRMRATVSAVKRYSSEQILPVHMNGMTKSTPPSRQHQM